jgi:hypothetical protein
MWYVRCLEFGAGKDTSLAGGIFVKGSHEMFSLRDDNREQGGKYSVQWLKRPDDALDEGEIRFLHWSRSAVFIATHVFGERFDALVGRARSVEIVQEQSANQPDWYVLRLSGLRGPVSPKFPNNPLEFDDSKVLEMTLDSANDWRLVEMSIPLRLRTGAGDSEEWSRVIKVEYAKGMDELSITEITRTPKGEGVPHTVHLERMPELPLPEEFTIAHYGFSANSPAPEFSSRAVTLIIIVGGALSIVVSIWLKRRSNASGTWQ